MHFFLFYQTNLKNHTGIWCFLSSRPHPSPVDRVRGFGFRAVSFFNLLQDGIDRFRSVPPACVPEEGFTADGITVECGSIDALDNEYQIREALEDSCRLINGKENIFEKALLALVLLSYIQAFSDGNKRTARITSNAILIANKYCPISFRTVDSVDYKKAMLIFYE